MLPQAAILICSWLLCCAYGHAAPQETCDSIGFTGHQLCSSCEKLHEFVGNSDLTQMCKSCCLQDDTQQQTTKFKKASLEVCSYRIGEFRNVESFVNDHMERFKRLKLVNIWGSPPKIVLGSGLHQETIRIDGWKTENIIEFLESRLES